MLYTYAYNGVDYDPAIPEIEIGLGIHRTQIALTLSALLDSGADASSVPIEYLREIGARGSEKKWMRGVAGGRYRVTLYPVFVQIGAQGFYVPVVGDKLNDEILLGRDVLNQLVVTLNGPAHMVEIPF